MNSKWIPMHRCRSNLSENRCMDIDEVQAPEHLRLNVFPWLNLAFFSWCLPHGFVKASSRLRHRLRIPYLLWPWHATDNLVRHGSIPIKSSECHWCLGTRAEECRVSGMSGDRTAGHSVIEKCRISGVPSISAVSGYARRHWNANYHLTYLDVSCRSKCPRCRKYECVVDANWQWAICAAMVPPSALKDSSDATRKYIDILSPPR